MTRVTIALCLIALVVLFVAYAGGVGVIHGGSAVNHMYWATAAVLAAMLANLIAVAHLTRSERIVRRLRALCEQHGIALDDLE